MILEHLPEELLLLVLRQLDLQSIQSLYDTGIPHVQDAIASGGIKKCDISRSTLATVNTLHTPFFIDVSQNLVELDLKGVQDLNRKGLLSAVKTMPKLSTLNIAYTNITIFHFLKIYDQCNSIKNICMNYEITHNIDKHFSQELVSKCQEVFANMEKVHFVGSESNLLYSSLPNLILKKANLISLTYTLAKNSKEITYYKYIECEPINYANFNLFTPRWRDTFLRTSSFRHRTNDNEQNFIKTLNSSYDFIRIWQEQIECSTAFESFFVKTFGIMPKVITTSGHYSFTTPQAFMTWDQKKVTFDEGFFKQLVCAVTPLLICKANNMDKDSDYPKASGSSPSSSKSDWVWMSHRSENFGTYFFPYQCPAKKKMVAIYEKLNYDGVLTEKKKIELSIYFEEMDMNPITVSPQSNFLTKLTYLSLTPNVRYSPEFFKVLFRCCNNLLTLNMAMKEDTADGVAQVSRSFSLSQSLKNIRLAGDCIKFNKLYKGMCSCKTLENIVIYDTSPTYVKSIGDPEYLIFSCEKLYYFCIEGSLTGDTKMKMLNQLNKVKKRLGRPYLHIEIANDQYDYDPFIEVFKLSNIKCTIMW